MKKKVVVIGGGFAGLQFVRNLKKDLFDILLLDKLNHHQFQPLFYQVATSQIEPSTISFPLRKVFQNRKDIKIRLGNVLEIEPDKKRINTSIGKFDYDYLVIATGCKTNYFGNEEIRKHTFRLKTTYQAITIRNSILGNFEKLLYAKESEKDGLLNITIVGGGATGVELAGAFAEIKRNILPKDFPGIDFSKLNVYLIEGSDSTLNNMSELAKKSYRHYLNIMGVTLKTGVFVQNYDGETLKLSNGETLKSKSVIWAAGVTGNTIDGLEKATHSTNRYIVNRINLVEGHENIFAIGDIAYMETPKYPTGHPQVANVAINQGKKLAKNLKAMQFGKNISEYEYKDLGMMATIGRNKAVVDLPFVRFKGYFAWFIWMFLHLMLILSVRNKLIVFINWLWNYISKNSSLRLILKENDDAGST